MVEAAIALIVIPVLARKPPNFTPPNLSSLV
jgi:hypothetical protein